MLQRRGFAVIRIHVLTEEGRKSSRAFNFPLQFHKRLLAEAGVDVRLFLGDARDDLFDCDVLFINDNVFGPRWPGLQGKVGELLEKGRTRSRKVVWFDTSDSSGTAEFQLLPHVDLYCKALVLVDRSAYLIERHGDRIFTDYYYRRDGVIDEGEDEARLARFLPAREDLSRIHVSWNAALGDFGLKAHRYRLFGRCLPSFRRYSAQFVPPGKCRTIDVSCRLGLHHNRATVLHHRTRIQEILARDFGLDTRPLPRREFFRELQTARVGVSPFGYGEVCFRDFEIIFAGAALLKPDMSHLETWPPLYLPGETYAVHRWDLSDLRQVVEDLLAGEQWREIAARAQRVYRRYLFERQGHLEFCGRVADIVRACGLLADEQRTPSRGAFARHGSPALPGTRP